MSFTEKQILDFATKQWGAPTLTKLAAKLSEESGEVSGIAIRIDESRLTIRDGVKQLREEVGDCLIVLSQVAASLGGTLEEIRAERFRQIIARAHLAKRNIVNDTTI